MEYRSSLIILIALLIVQNRSLALVSKGLECFQCLTLGNEGDKECDTPILGKTHVVQCSNSNDVEAAEARFNRNYVSLITKIQDEHRGQREKRNAGDTNNLSDRNVEVGQPICFKLSFKSKGIPVVVRGCKLAEIVERKIGCQIHPDGKTTGCVCSENCVPKHVGNNGKAYQPGKLFLSISSVIPFLLLMNMYYLG